jgi:putative ABC transport system ATP-binding protein
MINFKNINLIFNGKPIFSNFSLFVEKGGKTAIKGRSGKGKTSLFNMLMGFIKPDSGEILIDGDKLSNENIDNIRKKIAWLPQNPDIIGRGMVLEQILLPFGFSANKHLLPDKKVIVKELEKLNLDKSILHSSFNEISGGEKQRIGIMISKLLQRKILLLDEPTSALDKDSLSAVINYLCEAKDTTVLSASHDEEWLIHCNNIIEI